MGNIKSLEEDFDVDLDFIDKIISINCFDGGAEKKDLIIKNCNNKESFIKIFDNENSADIDIVAGNTKISINDSKIKISTNLELKLEVNDGSSLLQMTKNNVEVFAESNIKLFTKDGVSSLKMLKDNIDIFADNIKITGNLDIIGNTTIDGIFLVDKK